MLVCFAGGSSLGLESQTDVVVGDDAALDEVCGHFKLGFFYLNLLLACVYQH